MLVESSPLFPEVKVLVLNVFRDARGYLMPTFDWVLFISEGLCASYPLCLQSFSKAGVIRGMHYQRGAGQTKLMRTLSGETFNVVVDIRPDSKTLGRWWGVKMHGHEALALYVPQGFANGFCATEDATVQYMVSSPYAPDLDGGIHYLDHDLMIDWPVEDALVSNKDMLNPSFKQYLASLGDVP